MWDLKIYQGHMSAPMVKFQWNKHFGLNVIRDKTKPAVLFGVYHLHDVKFIRFHQAPVVIVWMGKDSLKHMDNKLRILNSCRNKVYHTTWLPQVQTELKLLGLECELIKIPIKEQPRPKPLVMGEKVYTYLQKGKPQYHGSDVVAQLELKHELLVGTHDINRRDWYGGKNNEFYSQCFAGLFLSEYAGGGMGIMEMGVRGIPVVTNVMKMPHCYAWTDAFSIEQLVDKFSDGIGKVNTDLVEEVYAQMANIKGCFDMQKLRK